MLALFFVRTLQFLTLNFIYMRMYRFSLLLIAFLAFYTSQAQVTKVPQLAKDNFAKQYPKAENAEWTNAIISVNVQFELNGKSMNAEYNNKGIWKSTLQDESYDQLPEAVLDGFKKSKYSDREVTDTKIIYYPGDVIQYRIKAEKNDVEKKYLFFDEKGKMLRESITL